MKRIIISALVVLLAFGPAWGDIFTMTCKGSFECNYCSKLPKSLDIETALVTVDTTDLTVKLEETFFFYGTHRIDKTTKQRYIFSGTLWDDFTKSDRKFSGSVNRYTGEVIVANEPLIVGKKLRWYLQLMCKQATKLF